MADFTVTVVESPALEVIVELAAAGSGGVSSYDDLTDVPTTFPPEAHEHDASEINVADVADNFAATDVEGALGELYGTVVSGGTPDATETVKGKAELATQAETNTGTDDTRIVTPAKLANYTGITNKALSSSLTDHLNDTSDAHDASAISYAGSTNLAATEVEAALDELDTEKATTGSVTTVQTNLTAHIDDPSDAHDASSISILDSENQYTATQVEGALIEVLDAVQAHEADTTAAHAASAVSFSPTGTVAATNVQSAIAEVASEAAAATRRFLNLGNVTTTSTPGSALYVGATFRPTMDGLTLKGVRFRDASNVNGVSYTLYLYNITSGVVLVASKAFTGTGTFQGVDFDTPQALTSGQIYELGFGTASATNIRYSGTSGNNIASGTVTEDFLGTSSGTLSTASTGATSRTTGAGLAPNVRMEYTVA